MNRHAVLIPLSAGLLVLLVLDSYGQDLFQASEKNRVYELVSLLESGVDVNARNRNGWTPLMAATARGNLEAVELLLASGADPSVASTAPYSGFTALMVAAYHGHADVVAALLAAGADVNAVDNHYYGETALMLAVKSGNLKSVQALIEGGVEVNAANRRGVTALMYAASYGCLEMVEALLAAGASTGLEDGAGLNAWRWAVLAGPKRGTIRRLLID